MLQTTATGRIVVVIEGPDRSTLLKPVWDGVGAKVERENEAADENWVVDVMLVG